MKRQSLILLLFCLFGVSARADSYRDSLQTMLVLTNTQQMSALGTMLVSPAWEQLLGSNLTPIVNQFVTSKEHLQMMTDIYEPAFRAHVSEEELAAVLHWCRTSKVVSYNQQSLHNAMTSQASLEYAQTNLARLKKVPAKAKKGKTVQVSPYNVSKSYHEAAYLCLDKMVVIDTLIAVFTPMFLQQIGTLTPEEQKMPEVQNFMRTFVKEWMVAALSMVFTEKDLRYYIQGVDGEPYKHCLEAIQTTQTLDKLTTMEFFAALASYINIYHPHLISSFEQAFKQQ